MHSLLAVRGSRMAILRARRADCAPYPVDAAGTSSRIAAVLFRNSRGVAMPVWLIASCVLCAALAAAYLLYVIFYPEDF
jgi:hypothetical protein